MRRIDALVIHASDTYPSMDIGVKEIRRWHLNRGWSDIGYHYVIRRNGLVETGRDIDGDGDVDEEIGAHALGHNKHTIGICMVGGKGQNNEPDCNFTRAQWRALDQLVTDLEIRYRGVKVFGHRDVSDKACPTFDADAWAKR